MTKCQVVFNALKSKSSNEWFLDSGCSMHMIGDKTISILLKTIMVALLLLDMEA